MTHDHEADALPQAAGFYRPSMGKVLFHVEKRGPAFEAAHATTRLMQALSRGVFLDVMPAWDDLLVALGVPCSTQDVTTSSWSAMVTAIADAMSSRESYAPWRTADAHVRAYARVAAGNWDTEARSIQDYDAWDDLDGARREQVFHAYKQAAELRAWAARR